MRIIDFNRKIFKTTKAIYFFRVYALVNENKKYIEFIKVYLFSQNGATSLVDFNEFYLKIKIDDEVDLLKLANKLSSAFFDEFLIITSTKEKALEITEHAANILFEEFKKELGGGQNG